MTEHLEPVVLVETPKQRSRRLSAEKADGQLRENRRTASHKLSRTVFFSLLQETGRCTCARCGKPLTEDTYSIEHCTEWLDAENPRDTFFDLKNIDFSCKICNSSHNRGKFGIRDLEENVLTVRKPLLYSHEIFIEEVAVEKIGFFQRIRDILNNRITWTIK